MRHDHRRRPPLRGGFLLEYLHAKDVVDVAVGVDGGVQPARRPAADLCVHRAGEDRRSGVHEHEAVTGVEGRDVGERGHERDSFGRTDQIAVVHDRVVLSGVALALPEPLRKLEGVFHFEAPVSRTDDA